MAGDKYGWMKMTGGGKRTSAYSQQTTKKKKKNKKKNSLSVFGAAENIRKRSKYLYE